METVYRAVVAYDGAGFRGFASNPGVPTVADALTGAIELVLGRDIVLACAGRTDAGVHAWGQVVSFVADSDVDPPRLQHSLNRMLGPEIVVRELEEADPAFDARHSAKSRTYRYQVLNRPLPDPFFYRTSWHVHRALDLDRMREAGQALLGTHDFSSFCRRKLVTIDGVETEAWLTRTVLKVEWRQTGDDIVEHWITATAFCQQMVRAVTGVLIEVGLGKRPVGDVARVLEARDRSQAAPLAPPHGLTLWSVAY